MRLLFAAGIFLLSPSLVLAQSQVQVSKACGSARTEQRTLANGLELSVAYSESGDITNIALTSQPLCITSDASGGVQGPEAPIDENQAWEVIKLLYANSTAQVRKVELNSHCLTSGLPSGPTDIYQLGDIVLLFNRDATHRLVSVYGYTGILRPDSTEPPN